MKEHKCPKCPGRLSCYWIENQWYIGIPNTSFLQNIDFCPYCGEKLPTSIKAIALYHDLEALAIKYDVRFELNYVFVGTKPDTECRIWKHTALSSEKVSIYRFQDMIKD